ncbi:uncharacterized protein Z518_06170 [Rhinocladiella mackenziei CBS 650.93]|uniref:Glycosyl hydrolase family 32 C-terminal domain-containing protein n=1 Tax=Rhinocladiella mackenziei CBS 650.93 TaxID=1442369 RepID=A0A0D2H4F0_9EURO|nr:uncharacterized protein Z518_06170 [Rhinocladiella mackenziei CBS 650.93]KIX05298.1 hypothetical protein Z518_06170 [Rhinocladiella mackenziei CBS 650.93]
MHPESTFTEYPHDNTKFLRTEQSLQWMCGILHATKDENGSWIPRMDYACADGLGRVTEEDLPQKLVDRQNWSGMLSLPHELSLICLRGVTGALKLKLEEITSIEAVPESEDTFTVRTLRISPATSMQGLRNGGRQVLVRGSQVLTSADDCFMDVQTCRFELLAVLDVSDSCSRIGLSIFHNEEHEIASSTMISFIPETETLKIDRPDSSHVDPDIHTFPETAPFTLFSFKNSDDGSQCRERLELHVFFDESVFEVFANSRCAFATRVYPATKRCWGIGFWAEDEMQASRLVSATASDGLRADIKVA